MKIQSFKQNKSAGHDGIGNSIIKRVANEISIPLSIIFNISLLTGMVPDKLKVAKVIQYTKRKIQKYYQTIDQFQCYLAFPKYLKGLYSTEVWII